MRKLLVILFITITLPLTAQEVRTARVINKPESAEKTEPTPPPRRSIIDRLLSREKPTPTPTPPPKAVVVPQKVTKKKPAKAVIAKPAVKPKEESPVKPVVNEPPAEVPAEKPAPTVATPPAPPDKPAEEPKTSEPPKTPEVSKVKPVQKPEKPDMTGLDDAGKYKAAKGFALKDPAIIDLKTKAESIIDTEDAKQATLNYNRALFKKIRAIEPTLNAYVDKLEQAVLKRVK